MSKTTDIEPSYERSAPLLKVAAHLYLRFAAALLVTVMCLVIQLPYA